MGALGKQLANKKLRAYNKDETTKQCAIGEFIETLGQKMSIQHSTWGTKGSFDVEESKDFGYHTVEAA